MTNNTIKTILLAEDVEQIAKLVCSILEHAGYSTTHVADGRAAIQHIDNNPPPTLMLLDVIMPHADGHQVLKHLRNNEAWKNVPVIMITDISEKDTVVKLLQEGANDFIAKPFETEALIERINKQIAA